jgi:hypothetical protein
MGGGRSTRAQTPRSRTCKAVSSGTRLIPSPGSRSGSRATATGVLDLAVAIGPQQGDQIDPPDWLLVLARPVAGDQPDVPGAALVEGRVVDDQRAFGLRPAARPRARAPRGRAPAATAGGCRSRGRARRGSGVARARPPYSWPGPGRRRGSRCSSRGYCVAGSQRNNRARVCPDKLYFSQLTA